MARKKVIDLDASATVQFEKVGQEFNGYLLGSKKINTEYGPALLHVFQTEEGNVGVYGSAKLDSSLANVPAGAMTFITFGGKVKIGGGKTMKKFDVEYDDEDTIEVTTANVNFNTSSEPEEDEASDDSEPVGADEDTDEDYADDEEEPAAKAPVKAAIAKKPAQVNAGSKSRVEQLLAKKRA